MKPDDALLQPALDIDEEQKAYARLLELWTHVGALVLLAAFAATSFGLLPTRLPLHRLPEYWGHTVEHFLALSGTTAGWGATVAERSGDLANLLGLALLVSGPPLCLLALVPAHARRRDWMQVVFCIAVAALMLLAAAGWPRR